MSMSDLFSELGPEMTGQLAFYTVYYLVVFVIAGIFSVISYILQGMSFYTVAKRRGIEKPWLAWVPIGNTWILGCISDQYRYVAKGQVKNRRKTMLVLEIVTLVLAMVVLCLCGAVIVQSLTAISMEMDEAAASGMVGLLLVMVVLTYGMLVPAIILSVHQYISYYDYFRSANPKLALIFLLVGILVGYPLPFFVFACRNKDLGMPPRQQPLPEGDLL